MIKISASFSKKIPGDEPYSSDAVHLGVEIELPDPVLTDQQEFSAAVRRLFSQARQEVEHQVSGPRSQLNGNSNGNDRHPANNNGNSRRPQLASPRQIDFLLSLARRNANLSPTQILDEAGVDKLTELTKSQASSLIDRFNGGSKR